MNNNETVTISLKTYEEMKSEIETLRKQVEEKIIVKNAIPENLVFAVYIIAVLLGFVFIRANF